MVNLRLSLSISRPTELVISDRSSTINTNSFFSTEPSTISVQPWMVVRACCFLIVSKGMDAPGAILGTE